MAKKTPPIVDKTFFYSDLNFFDSEYKNALWCSQQVFYAKLNYIQFLDSKRQKEYRRLEKLELDESVYKQIIDPITPMGKGGTAEYFASDWKANPIHLHLRNIVRAKLNKIGFENEIQVTEIDKYAKTQKQKDKDKIIWQREFRNLINDVNKEIGLPAIKDSQTPYSYVKSLGEETGNAAGSVDTLLDYIKSQVRDKQDLALYQTYVYKGDLERAFEMGIKHYLINLNKWSIVSEHFNEDLLNFNKGCGRWYTDETTGRGIVEYLEPDRLFTTPFKAYNGEDITGWFYEKDITFAEFVRQFGTTLTNEQLKEVFELNKDQGAQHGMVWSKADSVKGSNAKIRIGYMSVLTQDADNFAVKDTQGEVKMMVPKKLSWLPEKNTPSKYQVQQTQKIYNVWYSFYYIPPPGERLVKNSQVDWAWLSRYIFNIHKDVDMYRYGVDMRYAKSTLVIYKDERPSFTDIEQAFMPKIHTAWHRFQNCLVNDMDATALAEEFLASVLNGLDESNKDGKGNGAEATLQVMRQLKQGGMAFLKMTDKQGNVLVDPSKFVIPIKNGLLEKAEGLLKIIMDLYTMMMMALAQNDLTQAQQAKPRTPVAGVQAALASSQDGIWFVEKAVREFLIMYGERTVQHIMSMIKEKKRFMYKERFEEFASVVGNAQVWMLEGIEDMHLEEIGITVSLEDVHQNQQYVVELANKMASENRVSYDAVGLVMGTVSVNWKYAYTLLMVSVKEKEREQSHKEELEFERAKQLEDKRLQTALALTQGKGKAKDVNIGTQAQADMAVNEALNTAKQSTMAQQKAQLLNNKLEQQTQKSELDKQEKTYDALSPMQ